MIGSTLGPYRVLDKIGEGGMGEVYLARDTVLNRDVALKVLPDSVSSDPDRLARFQREAESLAALNHPNIAHIYGLERSGDRPAIAMELVGGSTLADRLRAGPMGLDEALPIARQIAEALEAAHERGIIHRDLKPANVKVTDDGVVKVLDFGLAKAVEPPSEMSPELANSPTLSARATELGVVLGTAAYMAPEQAKGKPVDKRADLWAFGCVLAEMLTGRRPFGGEDVTDTLASVLKSDPNLAALPADTPPSIRKLLQRCLEKDRKRRLADAADARYEIDEALAAPAAGEALATQGPAGVSPRTVMAIALVALLAGATLAALTLWLSRPTVAGSIARFLAVSEAEGVGIGVASGSHDLTIAPDGARVVFNVGNGQLAIRSLDTLAARPIENLGSQAYGPFISPDGAWLGFNDQADNTIKRVSMLGGPAQIVCDVGAGGMRGASWAEDDTIVFGTDATGGGLWSVPASGGTPRQVTEPEPGTQHRWPEVLPGGPLVLFTVQAQASDTFAIALLDLESGDYTVVLPGGSYPKYLPSGHLLYAVEGTLFAVGFDLDRRAVTTGPTPVLGDVVTKTSGAADFDVDDSGALVYLPGSVLDVNRTLVWVDREGREASVGVPPRTYYYPRLSPDGTRVALDVREEQSDIWIWDLARSTFSRLTTDAGIDRLPVWSPDGDRVAYASQREGVTAIFWEPADGTGPVERLVEGPEEQYTSALTPDGTQIVLVMGRPSFDLMIADLGDAPATARPLVASEFAEWNGEVSPDGRWLAYQSDESGQFEVYVRPFPDVDARRWPVSNTGGTRPAWRGDSRELFYFDDGRMMAVAVGDGPGFEAGEPRLLFEGDYSTPQVGRVYDVTPDGQRFLLLKDLDDTDENRRIVVVLNWTQELERLAPVR